MENGMKVNKENVLYTNHSMMMNFDFYLTIFE